MHCIRLLKSAHCHCCPNNQLITLTPVQVTTPKVFNITYNTSTTYTVCLKLGRSSTCPLLEDLVPQQIKAAGKVYLPYAYANKDIRPKCCGTDFFDLDNPGGEARSVEPGIYRRRLGGESSASADGIAASSAWP